CNSQRLLTEATVGAYRAGSRVDFSSTGCCVALSRSSLLPEKKLLVPFKACLFVTNRLPVVLLFVNTIFILGCVSFFCAVCLLEQARGKGVSPPAILSL